MLTPWRISTRPCASVIQRPAWPSGSAGAAPAGAAPRAADAVARTARAARGRHTAATLLGSRPVDERGEDHLRARPDDQAVALEVHDQPLEVGVVASAYAGDGVGLAGNAPGFDDLGVAEQRL